RGVQIKECDPRLYVTEYPGMSQKRAEYLMSMPLALLQHGYYVRQLTTLLAQRKPYPALVTLKPILEQQAKIAKDILDATEDLLKETQLRLVDCLAEGLINQISVITNADRSEDYLEQLHQKQAQSLETMLALLVGVKKPDLEQAATAIQESMQTAQEGRDQAIRAGLEGVRTALAAGGYLDGRLAMRLERLRQGRPLAEWLRLAQVGGEPAGLLNALGVYLALQRGNLEPNDAELFFCATAYEALLTGDPARIAAATQRIAAHSGGALHYELLERLRQFRLLLHEMRVSLAVGRLRADDVRIESPWQEVRESILAIMTDRQAGRFKSLGPEIEARLEKLRKLQPAFLPWSGRTALRNKAFPALANEAEKICVETIAALEPAVVTEVKAILSETNMVLPNVAFNIQKETERLQTDRKELALEVKKGIVERKAKENTPEEQKVKWRHAAPDRLLFSDRLIQRIAVHSIVFEKLLDFREWLWIRNPAAASLADLCPAAILAEYLKLLEQETYRKAVMGHQTSNYPYQLEVVSLYYETLIPVFASLHKWATRLGAGGAPTLMDDKAFVASLARFKQPNQYGAMKKAWDSHIKFHAACAAANDPAAKDRLLLSLQSCEVPSAFWDRLVFATETIRLLAAQIYSESQKPAWTGIQPAQETAATAAIGRIKKLLPDPKSMPDQAQLLMEALTDWPRIAGQITPKKLASLPPPKRQELGQNIGDWLESFSKARDNLAELVAAPVTRVPRTKFRTHALMFRFDVLGRMERGENQWLDRISRTTRGMWSQRAQAVASDGSGVSAITAADADWSASYEQRVRRKSTAASASRIRSGGTGTEAADYGSLKMPVYLYEALLGAAKCPYPNQFKNPGTRYIQRLLQEAR
ncbi:MAG: hypothetical protein KKD76_04355, partial [Verrucomicrobia bacterium]|nr:hypothetical protein [Verrucomicrobiota bacterium]